MINNLSTNQLSDHQSIFSTELMIKVSNVLSKEYIDELSIEGSLLKRENGTAFHIPPHSSYTEVLPQGFDEYEESHSISTKIRDLYKSSEFIDFIKSLTGYDIKTMMFNKDNLRPNCKLNCYDLSGENYNKIEWHYDRDYNVRGKQLVVVLTLHNDIKDDSATLEYFPTNSLEKKGLHLEANSLTIHDPTHIIHRVPSQNTGKVGDSRHVVVMKYSVDPTLINGAELALKQSQYYVKYGILVPIKGYRYGSIAFLIVLILFILFVIAIFFKRKRWNKSK